MKLTVLLLLLGGFSCSRAAKILVMSPLGPRSHVHGLLPLVEELASRGHEMTLVTAHTHKIKTPGIVSIVLNELVDIVEGDWYDFKHHDLFANSISVLKFFETIMSVGYGKFMANKDIQKIVRNKGYDLVIMDGISNDFAYPLLGHLGVPFILNDPGPGTNMNLRGKSASLEYASIPPALGDYSNDMTFFERMANAVLNEIFLLVREYYLLGVIDKLAKKDFPNGKTVAEIERDAELCFANLHPSSSWPRPLPPTFIPIPAMHVGPSKPLPEDLKKFADGADKGLIVFTLGSNTQVSDMPGHVKDAFVRVFSRIPQRVIWKWEKQNLDLSPNVKAVDWLPQQDLLGHPNTKAFIYHCGLLGLQEAIYHGVPVLGLPLGRDQRFLLNKAVEDGYAVKLEWEDVTEERLYNYIQLLINQPSYKANATRVSMLMRDQPMPSRQLAAYWVEHVLRHGGTKHLQLPSKNMPFYKQYMLDVWLFFVVVLTAILYILRKLLACACRRKSKPTQPVKQSKSTKAKRQ